MASARNAIARRSAGFTLVEMLVVILIISALAGLIAPAVMSARRRADRQACRLEMERLCLAIENFANFSPYGDYPPATLAALGIPGGNGVNEPNESLVLCLSAQHGDSMPFDFDLERLVNADEDDAPENVLRESLKSPFADGQLREYVDLWRTPYVFFPFRAYGTTARYQCEDGREFEAKLERDAGTGAWPAPLRFVLWSAGPNGINENGAGDDIVSWR